MIDVTCEQPASVVVASPVLKLATNSCTGFITAASLPLYLARVFRLIIVTE
jgi:hypothetical protein